MNHPDPDFHKLFVTAPALLIVLNTDLTIAAVSDAYLNAAKMERERVLGKNFFEVFPDGTEGALQKSLDKVLWSGTMDIMEARKYEIPRAESAGGGTEFKYWSSINIPVKSSLGKIEWIVRRVEDVTTIVKTEGELKTLEEERNLMFDHSFDLMAIVGSDGYFKRVNPAFERVLGYSEEQMYAKPIVEFLHEEDVPRTKAGIQNLALGTRMIASVNRYLCQDGSYKWFSWNTTPMGSLFYTVGRDITEQIKAEDQIRRLNLELEKKNEDLESKIRERVAELQRSEVQVLQLQKMDAVGRLAGGIAHDFNNMLGAISVYCDLLLDDAEKPAVVRENVQEVRAVTERAAALTRQLLVFSRKQIIQLRTISLNPLIQQLEKMLIRLIGENIKIILKLPENLRSVNVDPSQMEQVILNLIVNAKDAMPKGGTITIETSNIFLDDAFSNTHLAVNSGDYVLLSVTDTGTGMDEETIAKIFEPFFTTKEVGKGTGLGLTTVYGIVKQCQGTIWVYSEPGQGTVFKVYLPAAKKYVEEPAEEVVRPPAVEGITTILLVEDDARLRKIISSMLERKGYRVVMAANGREALEICETHEEPIHLLLTDMVMPGLNGLEVATKAAALRPSLRVLYMSGYTDDVLESSGIQDPSTLDFIQKPFDTHSLVTKVQKVLRA